MNDGREASVTPDGENLDLDGDQAGPETGNSGRRVFVGLGDDQSKQTQEMRHWMRLVEERLAQKPPRKRGCFRSRSGTRDSRSPSFREHHPRRRRRSTTPRRSRTPDYHDDGWEQGIVSQTPFAPHILRVRFPKSFTKPTDMGYDGSTDPEDHLDAFEGIMYCECAGDAMRYKAFPISLAGQGMR
ncbi:hypothetical protein PIB30_096136 [Stylosanthes scabra]|uniref:Reverse transcriptase domain-containing protein n=1 Tax=Stylosanthes scabra TaxID=79078 RepID=A0ABU6YWL3_9FABA|nr:hypothetical protein [Stylosanthes scabra]